MHEWRLGEDIGSKETDGCPLTPSRVKPGIPSHLEHKGMPFSCPVSCIFHS
jgi:hypothetical protein